MGFSTWEGSLDGTPGDAASGGAGPGDTVPEGGWREANQTCKLQPRKQDGGRERTGSRGTPGAGTPTV